MSQKIPVTIVSGFLGAGKTTLINKILKEEHGEQIAVIINEFGEMGVDHQFVLDVEEEIYQMDNGCLCCTLRTDIADMLKSILLVREQNGIRVDRVLIETTGLADPAPLAQTFINLPFLNDHFIVDAVVTIVDAKNFLYQARHQVEVAKQVGFADKILISKHSLVEEPVYRKVVQEVRSINPFAAIQDMDAKPVRLKDLFDLQLFYASEEKILQMEEASREDETCQHCGHHHDGASCDHDHDKKHYHHDDAHDHKYHHHHSHHSGINSFVIESEQALTLEDINVWLNELIYIYGPELYRYKGILNVQGVDYQLIFQGVQMSFDISRGRDWNSSERKSTLVFIGKQLPEDTLRESFATCMSQK